MGSRLTRGLLITGATILFTVAAPAQAENSGRGVPHPITMRNGSQRTVVVQPGDHLWKISEHRLGEVLGRDPEDAEVSPFWRAVIDSNVDRLRSGDPDLIYPGEEVFLPPTG